MLGRNILAVAATALLALSFVGCSGEKGAKVSGVIVENGQPLSVKEKEAVQIGLVPVTVDEKSNKANPGATFKRDDSSFVFVGPGQGLVPPGNYKVTVAVRPRDGSERYAEQFTEKKTPLTYTVTEEPVQEIVIDLKKKTVTRK